MCVGRKLKHEWRYDTDPPPTPRRKTGPKPGTKPKPRAKYRRVMPSVPEVRNLLAYIDTARREHLAELARENRELLQRLAPETVAELDRRRAEDRARFEAFEPSAGDWGGHSTSSTLARERELARRENAAKLAAAREMIEGREFAE